MRCEPRIGETATRYEHASLSPPCLDIAVHNCGTIEAIHPQLTESDIHMMTRL